MIYAYFFVEANDPSDSGDAAVSGWVELDDEQRRTAHSLAELMQDKWLIEGFTLVDGTPPAGRRVSTITDLAECFAQVALEVLSQSNHLDPDEWLDLGESLEPFTPTLLNAVREEFNEEDDR